MQQHIQNTIVNAVEDEGFHRSDEVNRVIDKVSESLAATLDSAVNEFVSRVESLLGSGRALEARDLFIEVGLAQAEVVEEEVIETDEEDEVDPRVEVIKKAKADLNEWLEKSTTLIAQVQATIAAL